MNNEESGSNVFTINFGVSVGRFQLGASINDILDAISNDYPRLQIELYFSTDESNNLKGLLSSDLQLNVPQWGLRLRFQHLSQKLFMIDIYDFNLAIAYNINGCIIRGHEHAPTFMQLHKALGPSFPGKFIADGRYLLRFDGVGLLFIIPPEYQGLYQDGKILPISLPDKTSAALQRVYVYAQEFDLEHPEKFPDTLTTTIRVALQRRNFEPSTLSLQPELGTHFHIITSSSQSGTFISREEIGPDVLERGAEERSVALGMTPQDVLSLLGTPDSALLSPPHCETFIHKYEYRKLGVEIYFSRRSHVVFRIVGHNNLVQHQDFGRFHRCGFSISQLGLGQASSFNLLSAGHLCSSDASCHTLKHSILSSLYCGSSRSESDSEGEGEEEESISNHKQVMESEDRSGETISTMTEWTQAQKMLMRWFPSIASESSEITAAIKPVPAGCPFPPTHLYAFPDLNVMFEVDAAGGLISSVTILDPSLIEI